MANGRQVVYPSGSGGGGGAPTTATYILETANGSLPNAFALGSLATGLLKNTTTTGVPSIATGADLNTTFGSQTQNQVYSAPSGSSGNPAFRALVAGDIPNLAASIITSGQLALARGGTNADLSATGAANSFLKQSSSGAAITVGTIASADINTALTTPGPIGGTTANTGAFTTLSGLVTDAATATVTDILTVEHDSSGTPAASFGTGVLFKGHSSTNTSRSMIEIAATWQTATDASRLPQLAITSYDANGGGTHNVLTLQFNSSSQTIIQNTTGSILIRPATTLALTLTSALATFAVAVTMNDALNIAVGTTTGTKIGTATNQKLAFFNSTPVVQPATTGTTTGFTAGAGTTVTDQSTFTGGTGSTAYRISDIVLALKNLGLMAA